MLWLLPCLPMIAAPALWLGARNRSRALLGTAAGSVLAATTFLAAWAAAARPGGAYRWGVGLTLRLTVDDPAAVVAQVAARDAELEAAWQPLGGRFAALVAGRA